MNREKDRGKRCRRFVLDCDIQARGGEDIDKQLPSIEQDGFADTFLTSLRICDASSKTDLSLNNLSTTRLRPRSCLQQPENGASGLCQLNTRLHRREPLRVCGPPAYPKAFWQLHATYSPLRIITQCRVHGSLQYRF